MFLEHDESSGIVWITEPYIKESNNKMVYQGNDRITTIYDIFSPDL